MLSFNRYLMMASYGDDKANLGGLPPGYCGGAEDVEMPSPAQEGEEVAGDEDLSLRPIDPLLDEEGNIIAGHLKAVALQTAVEGAGMVALLAGLSFASSREGTYARTIERQMQKKLAEANNAGRRVGTKKKFLRQVLELEDAGIVRETTNGRTALNQTMSRRAQRNELVRTKLRKARAERGLKPYPPSARGKRLTCRARHHSTYFVVPKGIQWVRAIFNGRRLSLLSEAPEPVNLLGVAEYTAKTIGFLEKNPQAYAFTADFRHWFHQIRLADFLWPYFGVSVGEQTFVWTTVPMGWSHSPHIAQSCSWSLVALTNAGVKGENPVDETPLHVDGAQLPFWLSLTKDGEEVGFVSVYYDNVIAWSSCKETLQQFERHFFQNCEQFGAEIKPNSVTHGEAREGGIEYLGTRVWYDNSTNQVSWECTKLKKWLEELRDTTNLRSCRHAASWIGRLVHVLLIKAGGAGGGASDPKMLRLAQTVAREGKHGWDSPTKLTMSDIRDAFLGVAFPTIFTRPTPSMDSPSTAKKIIASDASDKGAGYIIYDSDGTTVLDYYTEMYSKERLKDHIYLKELSIAQRAILRFNELYPNEEAVLVNDNSAVAWTLRNGVSSNSVGNAMVSELHHLLGKLHIIQVVSADNPADVPSRKTHLTQALRVELEQRQENMRTAIRAHERGYRWASKRTRWTRQTDTEECILRHGVPDDAHTAAG